MDDMSGMSDMGGMSMDMGLFVSENQYRAQVYWIVIASFIALLFLLRIARTLQGWLRRRTPAIVSIPQNAASRAVATCTAVFRELTYPVPFYFTGSFSKYFTPPSTGKILLLACYWTLVLTLLLSDVFLQPDDPMYPYYWEKVGFRAAWISVSQIPLIYLLSCKFNPISFLTGISYERFNWFHRWAARTVFITVIIHWSYFFTEWSLSDFISLEFEMMPMIKYGFGAWAVIGWMVFSGAGFFRAASYEFFVLQHICAAAFLLWLIYVHIPAYAMYNVWLSTAFVSFDWGMRLVLGIVRNTHLFGKMQKPGYSTQLEPLTGEMVRLTIDEIDFSWRAGQHIHLSMPSLRPLELHPFTIANSRIGFDGSKRSMTLLIKAHKGFSKSLYKAALRQQKRRVLLNGPFGIPPDVSHYDTVVLIACSSGASFIVPVLQELVRKRGCVRQIIMHWMIREAEHAEWFSQPLAEVLEAARGIDLPLEIVIHVTRFTDSASSITQGLVDKEVIITEDSKSSSGSSLSGNEKTPMITLQRAQSQGTPQSMSTRHQGRPTVDSLIRPGVESALGETAVVTCGGLAITAEIRTYVGQLSDERAVHKGTGAQGIFLFTETYGW